MDVAYDPLNPYPWYAQMRQSHPIVQDEQHGNWQVFRYADARQVLTDPATFSSAIPIAPQFQTVLTVLDPPYHKEMRSVLASSFTPKAIAALSTQIETIAQQLVNARAPQGEMDVVDDLAYPLPAIVIAKLLGIPPEDRGLFRLWSRKHVAGETVLDIPAQDDMPQYFRRWIGERRQTRQDDLLSQLIQASIGERCLTEEEILGYCYVFIIAGIETAQHVISWSVYELDERPEIMESMRSTPALLPSLVEEILRYRTPFPQAYRVTTSDTSLGATRLPKGQLVFVNLASANRDETQFPHADLFDPQRSPNEHLALGEGIHYCLGAHLGRLEAIIALQVILQRLPRLRRVRHAALEPVSAGFVYGLKHLPVTFQTDP